MNNESKPDESRYKVVRSSPAGFTSPSKPLVVRTGMSKMEAHALCAAILVHTPNAAVRVAPADTKRWEPILASLGITGAEKLDWMGEYAEYHQYATFLESACVQGIPALPNFVGRSGTVGFELPVTLCPSRVAAQP